MTKKQFLKKVKSLCNENRKEILKRAERIISSGAINFESYENNFLLPKMFMTAVSKEMASQWSLDTPVFKYEVKNIMHFI